MSQDATNCDDEKTIQPKRLAKCSKYVIVSNSYCVLSPLFIVAVKHILFALCSVQCQHRFIYWIDVCGNFFILERLHSILNTVNMEEMQSWLFVSVWRHYYGFTQHCLCTIPLVFDSIPQRLQDKKRKRYGRARRNTNTTMIKRLQDVHHHQPSDRLFFF